MLSILKKLRDKRNNRPKRKCKKRIPNVGEEIEIIKILNCQKKEFNKEYQGKRGIIDNSDSDGFVLRLHNGSISIFCKPTRVIYSYANKIFINH